MAKPYRTWKRGKYFYFRLRGWTTWKSTGCKSQQAALDYILEQIEKNKSLPERKPRPADDLTLRQYSEPFYLWDRCPHVLRLRDENKQITKEHVLRQRSLIVNHILEDPIAEKIVTEIRRRDVIEFRRRLLQKTGPRTVNKTIGVLKCIYREGILLEDLDRNPCEGVGNIKYQIRESGIFTREEIQALFPKDGLGPWADLKVYCAFLIAATCGLRRGEILALRWKHLDFDELIIHVQEAMKSDTEIGKPKWEKERNVPLPSRTALELKKLRGQSMYVLPESFVFSRDDGRPMLRSWCAYYFERAMEKAGIDRKKRQLRPHSFRHSLNMILRDAGYDAAKTRAALGWSSAQIQEGYTHWKPEHLQGQAKIIDSIFK